MCGFTGFGIRIIVKTLFEMRQGGFGGIGEEVKNVREFDGEIGIRWKEMCKPAVWWSTLKQSKMSMGVDVPSGQNDGNEIPLLCTHVKSPITPSKSPIASAHSTLISLSFTLFGPTLNASPASFTHPSQSFFFLAF